MAEELVHAATHGVGALLSLGALVTLVASAITKGTPVAIAGATIFGLSLVMMYATSTLYHAVPSTRPRLKDRLRIADHVAIHLLIAGTSTPVLLSGIGGTWGWTLASLVWSVAALGVIVEITPLRHLERLSIGVYLAAGWLLVLAMPLMWSSLPPYALLLLVLGGVAYTAGVPFFLADGRAWMHAAWHAFVLAGSAFHVAAVLLVLG